MSEVAVEYPGAYSPAVADDTSTRTGCVKVWWVGHEPRTTGTTRAEIEHPVEADRPSDAPGGLAESRRRLMGTLRSN